MRTITFSTNDTPKSVFADSAIRFGENLATRLDITIADDFKGYDYYIEFKLNEQTPVITGQLVPVNDVISYVITNALTSAVGSLKLEIQAYSEGGYLQKTATFWIPVKSAIDETPPTVMPEAYVPWYTQAVTEAGNSLASANDAEAQAIIATTKAGEALTSANNALLSEQNADISEVNALLSEQHAKTSEDLTEADKVTVTQTMQDFLAMLGTDVATLTGGKLTPSQIPAISINSTFTVTNESQITGLTAQEGDVAIVVPVDVVTDTYMLAGSDPTILSNWKKLGVAYVSEAGHAVNADNAVDSTKINGHRVVVMTQAEYDVAVKDPDTVYLVSGV